VAAVCGHFIVSNWKPREIDPDALRLYFCVAMMMRPLNIASAFFPDC
jgi:hypothetical protein